MNTRGYRSSVTEGTIDYEWWAARLVSESLIEECSALYSGHYGRWSDRAPAQPGERVRLSPSRLQEWLARDNTDIYVARSEGELIGYAIVVRGQVADLGIVAWVTQLVVHTGFRELGIAKSLLYSIWSLSDYFAWGLVTASPYAVRALEKATRRRCRPLHIAKHEIALKEVGVAYVPYISDTTYVVAQRERSAVFTAFYIDHSEVPRMLSEVVREGAPWRLGQLDEGWEWFAFTFRSQDQIGLSSQEIADMLAASDQVTMSAYARMQATPRTQAWMRHTPSECDDVIRHCNLKPGDSVIDFGSGNGRHCVELARRGMNVTGVDYVESNTELATRAASGVSNVRFITNDCRTVRLPEADGAICLYDVVGSYADDRDNSRILANLRANLKNQGYALISVMNYASTLAAARHTFRLSEDANSLMNLPPSQIMATTGDVFDPDYYMVDTETHVVYRREQFLRGNSVPLELLVRDRRFLADEIKNMCLDTGFDVIWVRHVRAGDWQTETNPDSPGAKEILVLCRKR